MAEAISFEFPDKGTAGSPNGTECGQALINTMNLWNWENDSEQYFKYRKIVQKRVDEDAQVLSDLFDLLDGQLKYRAVTMLTNDAGKVKPEAITLELIARIIDYDFILDSFYVEAHRDVSYELPKRVNNWLPFVGEIWELVKGEKYKSVQTTDPTNTPTLSPERLKNAVILSQAPQPYTNRSRFSVSYDEAVNILQENAKELWLVSTISDTEMDEVIEVEAEEIKTEGGKMLSAVEAESRITVKDVPWLNMDEWQRNYDSIGLVTKEQWDFKTSEEGNLTITSKSYRDSIADTETDAESEHSVLFADIAKATYKAVLKKIEAGDDLSETEEKIKELFKARGKGEEKKMKSRISNYMSEYLNGRYKNAEYKALAQRLKNNGFVPYGEAMDDIGCNEWFCDFAEQSFLWHCNYKTGAFYYYFEPKTVEVQPWRDPTKPKGTDAKAEENYKKYHSGLSEASEVSPAKARSRQAFTVVEK